MLLNGLQILLLGLSVFAAEAFGLDQFTDENYYKLSSVQISEVKSDVLNQETSDVIHKQDIDPSTNLKGIINPENTGEVINVAKDLVALGESVYALVQKGRPNTKTTYAPISVIPLINGQPVDIFETENWKMPKRSTYEVVYKNLYGMEVVKYRYSVIFSYGGTFQERGAYLTATQIVPESVYVSWGFDFSATMKLGGIQNQGSRNDPVAAAVLLMEYRVETFLQSRVEARNYMVNGRGILKGL